MMKIPSAVKVHFFSFLIDLRRVVSVALLVATATAILLFHVSQQIKMTRLSYQIAEVTDEHRRLLEERNKLAIEEEAVQGSAQRVVDVAREKFGLHRMKSSQLQTLPMSLLTQ